MITQATGDRIGRVLVSQVRVGGRGSVNAEEIYRPDLFGALTARPSSLGHAYLPVRSWLREGVQMGWI